jgi:hypothetical protein
MGRGGHDESYLLFIPNRLGKPPALPGGLPEFDSFGNCVVIRAAFFFQGQQAPVQVKFLRTPSAPHAASFVFVGVEFK